MCGYNWKKPPVFIGFDYYYSIFIVITSNTIKMKAYKLPFLLLLFGWSSLFAQKDTATLTKQQRKDLLQKIGDQFDSSKFLGEISKNACKCIDSIGLSEKDDKQKSAAIAACIDAQAQAYQLMVKMNSAFKDGNLKIIINVDKESNEYKRYYYQIEEWLADSCASMKILLASNEKVSEFSVSKNIKALQQYDKGIDALKGDNYKDALPWFNKAVEIDPKFAFAWDNIGICNRHLGNLDKALEAYNRSLALDPHGKTPLQNIPVVFQMRNEYDKAIDAYNKLLESYPGDPEGYFGVGRMYVLKSNYEKGLDNMCKAYNIYAEMNSPYRVDAQTIISEIYKAMKSKGQEELFYKILKDNHIKTQ